MSTHAHPSITRALIFVIWLLSGWQVRSQNAEIQGRMLDSTLRLPLRGVTVSLTRTDVSGKPQTMLTDSTGLFRFTQLPFGSYALTASAVGFMDLKRSITLASAQTDLGETYLSRKGQDLGAVTVIARAPAVVQKDDTSQYNASQYKVNPDATTEDLIKKMPSITVDRNGGITAQGEQVRKVTVDGKDFFGEDAAAAIRNIPASVVDKIQVFDRLSDQAQLTGIDDGNTQKSINIITKAGISNAQFGRVYAGGGTDDRYSAGGNASFFRKDRRISLVGTLNNINQQNFGSQDLLGITGTGSGNIGGMGRPPGGMGSGSFRGPGAPAESFTVDQAAGISTTYAAGINYSDKWGTKTTITGSYFFNQTRNDNRSNSNTLLFEEDIATRRESDAFSRNINHRINARIEFKADSANTFFLIPSINFQGNRGTTDADLQSFVNPADSLFQSASRSDRDRQGYNIRNNLMYRHSFKKKNRIFSAGVNTTFTRNDGTQTTDARFRYYDNLGAPILPDSLQQQFTDNNTDGYSINTTLTYNEPLGKNGRGQLQLEYVPGLQRNRSDQQTFALDGGTYSAFDSLLSNRFTNIIRTHNGGVTYRFTPSKDEQFSVGLSYQRSRLSSERTLPGSGTVDQSFANLLPNANWRKKISSYANVRMFYRASPTFPTITQLQDVVNLTNPLSVSSGNKQLKQSYTQFMGGRYSYSNTKNSRSLFAGVFMQRASDYITNATFVASQDSIIQQGIVLRKGSQLTKPVNLDGYVFLRSYLNVGLPIKKLKTTLNLNTSVVYSKLPGLVNNVSSTTRNTQYNLGLALVSNLSEYVDYNVSYNAGINRALTTGSLRTENNYVSHNLNVVFNLLSKKGWFFQNDLSLQAFNGLTGGLDRQFTLWNLSVGKKLFRDKVGELKLSVFDLLRENQSVSRTVTNTYLEDSESIVLQRYFMLTFSYNLKNFGKPQKAATEEFIPPVGVPGRF